MTGAVGALRRTPLVAGVAVLALVVLLEISSYFVLHAGNADVAANPDVIRLAASSGANTAAVAGRQPPGIAIAYLALVDGLLLFTMLLVLLGTTRNKALQSRVQGVLTLALAVLVIIGGIMLIIVAIATLVLMVTLFLAVPFGTIVYLIRYGNFDTGAATAVLATIMALKLAFCVALVLGQQRFLQMKGLVALVVTSIVCTALIGILHGVVPVVLVAITDAIAALVIAVIAVVWALVLLVGATLAIVKTVQVKPPALPA